MTQDGVDGTAADSRPNPARQHRVAGPCGIKRDDGWRGARYIEPAYSHTPAGISPDYPRRERQVAAALSNDSDLSVASSTCSAGAMCGPAKLDWRAATGRR